MWPIGFRAQYNPGDNGCRVLTPLNISIGALNKEKKEKEMKKDNPYKFNKAMCKDTLCVFSKCGSIYIQLSV